MVVVVKNYIKADMKYFGPIQICLICLICSKYFVRDCGFHHINRENKTRLISSSVFSTLYTEIPQDKSLNN